MNCLGMKKEQKMTYLPQLLNTQASRPVAVAAFALAFFIGNPWLYGQDKIVAEPSLGQRLDGQWNLDVKLSNTLNKGRNVGEKTFMVFEYKHGEGKKGALPKGWREEFRGTSFLTSPKDLKIVGMGNRGKKKVAIATAGGKTFMLSVTPNYGVVAMQVILVQAGDKKHDRLYLRLGFRNQVFNFAYKRKS